MTKEYFARELARRFPEHRAACEDHLRAYGEVVGHVLFCEINPVLSGLLRENRDPARIRQYMDFIEEMYRDGDGDVRNIVEVTILEYLGDDEIVLRRAFSHFSEALMEASRAVEAGWGRREIRLWRKNGRLLYEWKPPQGAGRRDG